MTLEARIAAELATIPEPRRGRHGWWVLGHEYPSRKGAEAHRERVARHRAETAVLEERQAAERARLYAEQGMHPAMTSGLQPGDTYSIPALRPPFRYAEYVVASVEALGSGAFYVRHESTEAQRRDPDWLGGLLHTSDTALFRRPAGE
jgi:hypothetical protein